MSKAQLVRFSTGVRRMARIGATPRYGLFDQSKVYKLNGREVVDVFDGSSGVSTFFPHEVTGYVNLPKVGWRTLKGEALKIYRKRYRGDNIPTDGELRAIQREVDTTPPHVRKSEVNLNPLSAHLNNV